MSFSLVAQEFVEALGKAPIVKQQPKNENEEIDKDEDKAIMTKMTSIPPLRNLLLMPNDVMTNTCEALGLSLYHAKSLISVIQSIVITHENRLSPAQSRPDHWNEIFRNLTESVVPTPTAYDSLLTSNKVANTARLEQDRAFMRLIILLHNAFAHRVDELRDALLSYVEGGVAEMKGYYQSVAKDVAGGDGLHRLDTAVRWNMPISARYVTLLMIHMAFHRQIDDGFELFHMRPLFEAAHCGLFGTSMFLGMAAAPSGVLSICISNRSYIDRLTYLFSFISEHCKDESDWFYTYAFQMLSKVHSILFYRPFSVQYPVDQRIEEHEHIEIIRNDILDHALFKDAPVRDVRIMYMQAANAREWVRVNVSNSTKIDDKEDSDRTEAEKHNSDEQNDENEIVVDIMDDQPVLRRSTRKRTSSASSSSSSSLESKPLCDSQRQSKRQRKQKTQL